MGRRAGDPAEAAAPNLRRMGNGKVGREESISDDGQSILECWVMECGMVAEEVRGTDGRIMGRSVGGEIGGLEAEQARETWKDGRTWSVSGVPECSL